jgi:hypothetical protein
MSDHSPLTAFWIWQRQSSYTPYHQVILAHKTFRLGRAASGSLKIAVDGGYRLFVNGEWVVDGPARSWPEHFQYDVIDVSPYLQIGRNELVVIARHWQVGDFHTRPRQAGLLVQLDLSLPNRRSRRIVSDESWQMAWMPAWSANTPKVSIQMEPQELYDARLSQALEYSDAAVLYPANGGPWQDLHPRDVALLARRPRAFRRFVGAHLVKRRSDLNFCLPAARLAHPQDVEANHFSSAAGGMATWLELAAPAEIQLALEGMRASVDGIVDPEGRYALEAGRHFVLAFAWPAYGHRKERNLRIVEPPIGLRLYNPLEAEYANPWVYLSLPAFRLAESDMTWMWFKGPQGKRDGLAQMYGEAIDGLLSAGPRALEAGTGPQLLPTDEMFVTDTHWLFTNREVTGSAADFVQDATALMHDNPALTTVRPSASGDIELVYDLGEETIGYFDFELLAPAGVNVDWYAVEYIKPDGTVQHSGDNHNGLRYITHAGLNRFTSLKRRAGRYFFITLRCPGAGCATEDAQKIPIQIRLARVIESTYPAEYRAGFDCSDASLGRIWQISARTLELCMEDTFTDCPLYEQTYWVGDARNESIFAYDAFGATDIALRCLRLAAQSLERYPLVGGQVPSCWDMLLPAWSFLWGIAAWDYYFYTADRAALEELWPALVRNLEEAEKRLDSHDLFSGPYWNMFDWSGIDDQHETVLHNSLLLVGAVAAAHKSAEVLGDAARAAWLAGLRQRLTAAINRCWDPARGAYPDSLLEDGTPSPSTCQHTSFLALLYDVIPAQAREAALSNTLTPPDGMVRVGSPFAIMYLYEALAKIGKPDAILQSIYENYLPMLQSGASTVWEVFPSSKDRPGGFPTRSHCHAWSSAPLHFLAQTVLGIRQTGAGGAAYTLSPWLSDLSWASGSVCTARGMIEVRWQRSGARVEVTVKAPKGVEIHCEKNDSMDGVEVEWMVRQGER